MQPSTEATAIAAQARADGPSSGMVALYRTVGGIAFAMVAWIFFVVVFVVLG
jgi:hypothetical protein